MQNNIKLRHFAGKLADTKHLAILFLSLAAIGVLFFQNDKVGFEQWHHGFLSSHGMTIAKNLSPEHDFLMFTSAESDGKSIRYKPYNRFPIFPFLLIKGVTLFSSKLSGEVYLARQLMNLFVILAMVFIYLMIFELTEKRFLGVLVTLIAFSSYFILYYSDMIFNDSPSLAGFTGVMYGIAVYEKRGKRKQLFWLAIFAVSMSWQVFSLLGVWWLYSFATGIINSIRESVASWKTLFPWTATLVIVASMLYGGAVLSASLYNESRMVGKPMLETPSARQIHTRAGLKEKKGLFEREWLDKEQQRRIAVMSTPYKIIDTDSPPKYLVYVVLALVVLAPLLLPIPFKLLFVTFGFSGFLWAIGMHNFTRHHDFQSLYYIGIPIAVYAGLLGRVPEKLCIALCIVALSFFFYANIQERDRQNERAVLLNQYTAEFETITDKLEPKSIIFVDRKSRPRLKKKMTSLAEGYYAVAYYTAGHYFGRPSQSDYIISRNRGYNQHILTPENKFIFLFQNPSKK